MREIAIDIRGLGLILYSPPAVGHIAEGADYLRDHFWEPADALGARAFVRLELPRPGAAERTVLWRGVLGADAAPALDLEGWLCPALFKYFDQAPERIYAQVKAKSG